MARRIRPHVPADLTDAQRALYDAITGGPRAAGPQHFALTADDGSLRGPFDALLLSPAVGTALQEVGAAIRYRSELDDRARELAILLVAARWDSAFERESHEAIARAIGFTDVELEALRREDAGAFADEEGIIARTVVALLDGDLDDARVGCRGIRPRRSRRLRTDESRRLLLDPRPSAARLPRVSLRAGPRQEYGFHTMKAAATDDDVNAEPGAKAGNRYRIEALAKGLDVLRLFDETTTSLKLREICDLHRHPDADRVPRRRDARRGRLRRAARRRGDPARRRGAHARLGRAARVDARAAQRAAAAPPRRGDRRDREPRRAARRRGAVPRAAAQLRTS